MDGSEPAAWMGLLTPCEQKWGKWKGERLGVIYRTHTQPFKYIPIALASCLFLHIIYTPSSRNKMPEAHRSNAAMVPVTIAAVLKPVFENGLVV